MDEALMRDRIIDEEGFAIRLRALCERLLERPGSAVVCTSELTPQQIEEARQRRLLVVRFDGIGFALVRNKRKV